MPTGLMHKGQCFQAIDSENTLKNILDSEFPIFMNSPTGQPVGYYVSSSTLDSAGNYNYTLKNSLGQITASSETIKIPDCDYDTQEFMTNDTNDILFIVAMVVVFALGLSGGMQR